MASKQKKFKRTTVTAALPYANGPIHIGHLAGVYIPSDIYVRYLRAKQSDVLFICGSDEHGVPITIRAKNESLRPKDIVDRYHTINKKAFEQFGISFDIFSRTSNEIHHEMAASIFKTLYNSGILEEKTTEQYYDEEQKQFLADRYITGQCPHCSYEKAYGDQCENCGTSLSPTDLINPKSVISGSHPVLKETKHWFLPLQKHEHWLKEWILHDHKEWKPNVYGQCKSWLDQGLQPRAVTRDLNWGVHLPLPDTDGKVLYVWFDAPIGYISATKEWAKENNKDWELYWKDNGTRLLHFIGKDNIVFHCIIFPVILKAEGSYILPDNVPANEFMNLEHNKISTSRNWAVWLHEYLEDFPGKEDVLRYVLTANAPETKDNDFSWKDFQARNNNELLAIFGNFVNRTLVLTDKYFDGKVPDPDELDEDAQKVLEEIKSFPEKIAEKLEIFKFREAQNEFMNLARMGNKYLTDKEPWKLFKTDPGQVKTILFVSLQMAASLSVLCRPFLPKTAEKLKNMLNFKDLTWEQAGNYQHLLLPGTLLNKPDYLFEQIKDEDIQKQMEKLQFSKNLEDQNISNIHPEKKAISYEDFSSMDIRTGTIVHAEKVPKTKKLLKLQVDTGLDKRTIVSGIADQFDPNNIIGKKISILVNLQAKKIKGIDSQGMILMATDDNGKLSFVVPEDDINNGSVIK